MTYQRQRPGPGEPEEFVNEDGIRRTADRHGMTLDQAKTFLNAEWAKWHEAKDAEKMRKQREKQDRARNRWRVDVAPLDELGLDPRPTPLGYAGPGAKLKGRRVDVDLDALTELIRRRTSA